MKRIAYLLGLAVTLVVFAGAGPRTWSDASGKFQVEAEFVSLADGKVTLKKEDGSLTSIPLAKLSADDQAHIRTELRAKRKSAKTASLKAGATAETTLASASTDWAQWRGPKRDGISQETGLLDSWPADGPPIAWTAHGIGRGYSSVAVAGGRVFTMGTRDGKEHLIGLDASDGQIAWTLPVGNADHSNCTPTVDGNLVFALGLNGDLVCADAKTGKEVWRKNFGQDFGGRMMSGWGFSESPLVDGDRLICTPGAAQAMMAALDKQTGKTIWTAAMPSGAGPKGNDGAGYSSIVVSEAAGIKQYVQLVGKGVIGVSAKDGKLLWGYNKVANGTANIPTPIVQGDYVFCSTGYGDGGSALLKLTKSGSGIEASEVYYKESRELQNHHGGMILVGKHLYFGHGHNNGFPVCVELATGNDAWRPGRGPGSGSAAIAFAEGNLYFRYEDGTMALIEATPDKYNLKGTFRIATRHDKSWPHPVISHGRLYLRDQDDLHCYHIKKD